jgi:hypothetical protein
MVACCGVGSFMLRSGLSDVLLQPVLDGTTENVMAVLCALNKADTSDGRDIFYEPTFTPSDW